jgi:acyl-CoA thioesterase
MALDFLELRRKIQESMESGRFFITISYIDKEEMVQHYWQTRDFPRDDMMPSLEHIAKKIMPETLEGDEESNT